MNKKKYDNVKSNISFEEAMHKIANTPKEDVEKAIKVASEKKKKEVKPKE